MIRKIKNIEYKQIKRISPSQFYSMKNCAYKSLLAEAFDKKPLLPVSPNAYFGIVLHKILELVTKGVIRNEHEFNTHFEEQVKFIESKLTEQGYGFLLPLQKNVKDFGLKKVLIKKHIRNFPEKSAVVSDVKFQSEKWFESKDKLIGGKIDLVIETDAEAEIIDFKTGAVTEDMLDDDGEVFTEVKYAYQEQLKLYAYLYFETMGKFPTRLSLVDVAKHKFSMDFSQEECGELFEEAEELLIATNDSIASGEYNANPSETNCMYCLYRPACRFYLQHLEKKTVFSDVSGSIKNVKRYQNGNVSIDIENDKNRLTISNFPLAMFDEFNEMKNKKINVFNLRKEGIDNAYSFTKTTQVYE